VELGHYDRANKLLLFPLNHIMNPLNKVMVPALSRANGNDERYRNAYLKTTSLVLFLLLPGIAFATATADILIPTLLGSQWGSSATIFQALGFAGLLQALNNPAGWLFVSQGRTGEFMRWGIVSSVTVVVAFVIGLPYGAVGVAIAYAVGEYIRTPLLWLYIGRKGPIGFRHILRVSGPILLAAHVALAAVWLTKHLWHADPLLILLGNAGLCMSINVVVALLFPGSRTILLEAFAMAMKRFRPKVSVAEGSA
jgi:PST family polysaccharide transporter